MVGDTEQYPVVKTSAVDVVGGVLSNLFKRVYVKYCD